jgi:hypothetical protein
MYINNIHIYIFIYIFTLSVQGNILGDSSEVSNEERKEYDQEWNSINNFQKEMTYNSTDDLAKYEKYADENRNKWSKRNKDFYAMLMVKICSPLGGSFKDQRQFKLCRQYVLSALENADEISAKLESDLLFRIHTLETIRYDKPNDFDLAKIRRSDLERHLHCWKHLKDSLDPNWDPEKRPPSPKLVSMMLIGKVPVVISGMSPDGIKDPVLREEYRKALDEANRKVMEFSNQSTLHRTIQIYPKVTENYIIALYSIPPYNIDELKELLGDAVVDEETKTRILETVKNNMEKSKKPASGNANPSNKAETK